MSSDSLGEEEFHALDSRLPDSTEVRRTSRNVRCDSLFDELIVELFDEGLFLQKVLDVFQLASSSNEIGPVVSDDLCWSTSPGCESLQAGNKGVICQVTNKLKMYYLRLKADKQACNRPSPVWAFCDVDGMDPRSLLRRL